MQMIPFMCSPEHNPFKKKLKLSKRAQLKSHTEKMVFFQLDSREELCNAYYTMLCNLIVDFDRNRNFNGRIVYTPMHGVGANYIDRAFQVAGFMPVIHVKEQRGNWQS